MRSMRKAILRACERQNLHIIKHDAPIVYVRIGKAIWGIKYAGLDFELKTCYDMGDAARRKVIRELSEEITECYLDQEPDTELMHNTVALVG